MLLKFSQIYFSEVLSTFDFDTHFLYYNYASAADARPWTLQ